MLRASAATVLSTPLCAGEGTFSRNAFHVGPEQCCEPGRGAFQSPVGEHVAHCAVTPRGTGPGPRRALLSEFMAQQGWKRPEDPAALPSGWEDRPQLSSEGLVWSDLLGMDSAVDAGTTDSRL